MLKQRKVIAMKKEQKSTAPLGPEAELPDMESVNERKHPDPEFPLTPSSDARHLRHNDEGVKTQDPAEGGEQTVEEAIRYQVRKSQAA